MIQDISSYQDVKSLVSQAGFNNGKYEVIRVHQMKLACWLNG